MSFVVSTQRYVLFMGKTSLIAYLEVHYIRKRRFGALVFSSNPVLAYVENQLISIHLHLHLHASCFFSYDFYGPYPHKTIIAHIPFQKFCFHCTDITSDKT